MQEHTRTSDLEAAYAELAGAVDIMSVGFSLYDKDDRLVFFNYRYTEMVDPAIAEVVKPGMTFVEAARAVAERGIIREAVGRVDEWLAERTSMHREPRAPHIQHLDTGRFLRVSESRTPSGGIVAIYEDVTELKQREQQLFEANRDTHAILGAVEYGVLFMDKDLKVRLANRAYRDIWGIEDDFHRAGETLSLSDYYARTRSLYDVDDASWDAFLQNRMQAIRDGRTDPQVSRLGNGKILKRQVIPFADGGRMITYFDITELKRAEDALRASEERYALALKGTNDGIWDWAQSNDQLYLSPRCKEIAGISNNDTPKAHEQWLTMLHPDDQQAYREALVKHLRGESAFFSCEHRVRGDDGVYRWVQNRGLGLRDDKGRVYRMTGSLTDIADRKDAELALLLAKEEAETATRAKDEFLANMSHELRTPLNAVIGITEMLAEEATTDGVPQFQEPLERVCGAGRHLLRLIDDILELTKIDSGKVMLSSVEFDAVSLAHDVATSVRAGAESRGNSLSVRIGDGVGTMRSDINRIRQIMLNITNNACKFTEDGQIELDLQIVVRDAKRFLQLRVSDTGIGMDNEQTDRLFEHFTQADSSSTRRYGGTGLGLSITKRLCEALDGWIEVTSAQGVGTTFTVYLPEHRD